MFWNERKAEGMAEQLSKRYEQVWHETYAVVLEKAIVEGAGIITHNWDQPGQDTLFI